MKTKNKPDLIVVLILFVAIGVFFSSYGSGPFLQSDESADLISASSTSSTAKSLYSGNFIKVSTKIQSKDIIAKDTGKSTPEARAGARAEATANQ